MLSLTNTVTTTFVVNLLLDVASYINVEMKLHFKVAPTCRQSLK